MHIVNERIVVILSVRSFTLVTARIDCMAPSTSGRARDGALGAEMLSRTLRVRCRARATILVGIPLMMLRLHRCGVGEREPFSERGLRNEFRMTPSRVAFAMVHAVHLLRQ